MNEFQELLNELLHAIQQVIQSGEVLSDEFQGELAQTISLLMDRVAQQPAQPTPEPTPETPPTQGTTPTGGTGEGQPPTGGSVPPLERAPHESSNINAFRYLPEKKQLYIKFMGKDTADSGPIYSYSNVEKNVFDIIARGGVGPLTTGKNKYHAWHRGILPSHGASVNALLKKGNYPYQRIS